MLSNELPCHLSPETLATARVTVRGSGVTGAKHLWEHKTRGGDVERAVALW